MQSTTTATVEKLREMFSRFGLLYTLVSDNGQQFVANELKDFMKANDVLYITSAPYHPSTNELA